MRSYLDLLETGLRNPGAVPLYVERKLLFPLSVALNARRTFGENVFDREWDLLVVLDTCRPDALRAVADEYDFLGAVGETWSVGGDSPEWMANTFAERHRDAIRETAYITSNPNAIPVLEHGFERDRTGGEVDKSNVARVARYGPDEVVPADEFGEYRNTYSHTVGHGQFPSPRTVTDLGIVTDRETDLDRIILHYMPPHEPYIARTVDGKDGGTDGGREVELLDDARDWQSFEAYLDNLRWGLNEVAIALANVDRERVVITADHGESFGRFGEKHRSGSVKPSVRKVPWAVTTATDSGTHHPDVDLDDDLTDGALDDGGPTDGDHSVDDVLEALGYTT